MIRHLAKLVWNRKRANGLIILEIFLSFLVVFLVVAMGASYALDYGRPVGFRWENVWYVALSADNSFEWMKGQIPTLQRVEREIATLSEVLAVTGADGLPMDGNVSIRSIDHEGRTVRIQLATVTTGFRDVFGIELARGRWFEEGDLGREWTPVVIDEDLARDLFGEDDPLGKDLPLEDAGRPVRAIGVVGDFRKAGELGRLETPNFVFRPYRPDDPEGVLTYFALRIDPTTSAEFEEVLVRRVRAVAPDWSVEVRTLEQLRHGELSKRVAPLIAVAIVAGFLLIMVGLGLIGVLWQNVTQRTREIGLRRAIGAHRGAIHRQILLELMLMTTIGVLAGTITVLQFPILARWRFLTPEAFALGLAGSVGLIYLLAGVCGFYPSWMATRVQPAEALHYE